MLAPVPLPYNVHTPVHTSISSFIPVLHTQAKRENLLKPRFICVHHQHRTKPTMFRLLLPVYRYRHIPVPVIAKSVFSSELVLGPSGSPWEGLARIGTAPSFHIRPALPSSVELPPLLLSPTQRLQRTTTGTLSVTAWGASPASLAWAFMQARGLRKSVHQVQTGTAGPPP